jgi:hypothetical protein
MRISVAIAVIASALAGAAIAKLPAPTQEQVEAAAAKKEKEKAQLEAEKQKLDQAQDRVADLYRRTKGGSGPSRPTGRTEDTNMPKQTKEVPGQGMPMGGKAQSAEAHSTPAK